jgi:hypothetical protein
MGGAPGYGGAAYGGAHVPSSMAAAPAYGGAHVPGSVAPEAHVAGGAGQARAPGAGAFAQAHPGPEAAHGLGEARGPGAARAEGGPREADPRIAGPERGGPERGGLEHGGPERAGAERGGAEHGGVERAGFEHGGGRLAGDRAAGDRADLARRDPRLAPEAGLHTRGVEAAMAERHEARPFLRPEEHRDVMRDRAFLARHEGDFHTRNVRDFSARELGAWRRGRWRNEWHYGRRGWWWDVDDVYYGYPEPLWPYPAEVATLAAYDTDFVDDPALQADAFLQPDQVAAADQLADGPPVAEALADPAAAGYVAQAGAPPRPAAARALPAIAPLPAPPGGSYRCADPPGYFPDVPLCAAPWELVRAPPG